MCKSYTPSQNFSKNIRLRHRWLKVLLWEPNVIKLTYCGNVCHYIQLSNHQFRTLKSSFYDGQTSWFILSVENDGIVLNGLKKLVCMGNGSQSIQSLGNLHFDDFLYLLIDYLNLIVDKIIYVIKTSKETKIGF